MDHCGDLRIVFPADEAYIPYMRGMVAEAVQLAGLGAKFAHRTEVVVDELLGNSIRFAAPYASVRLNCEIQGSSVKLRVSESCDGENERESIQGLEIVRMLSTSVDYAVGDNGECVVEVIQESQRQAEDSR